MVERATPMEQAAPPTFETLLRTVAEMDTPDGFKAELIRGKIIVSPFSSLRYLRSMRALREQLKLHAPEGHVTETSPFLFRFPATERAYGPDLFVADEAAFEDDGRHADSAALSLVAEFTSTSTKDVDWNEKLEVYGQVVPVYLVADMQAKELTCFSEPSPHGYRSRKTVSFGEELYVPEPFDCTIGTTGFQEPLKRPRAAPPVWGVPPSVEEQPISQRPIRSPCHRPACRRRPARRPSRACRR
ncbi:Uma2 family endonuclease [Streptomyces sp. NPDC059918]|uniref:Uma2 family endonuclease n=1 Tax=unclassified Streptomyces TaxID=2593676 RepID=UPI00365DBD02